MHVSSNTLDYTVKKHFLKHFSGGFKRVKLILMGHNIVKVSYIWPQNNKVKLSNFKEYLNVNFVSLTIR